VQRSSKQRDEQGVMAIEFLLVISMLVVVFLLMLQYAVKAHADRIAAAAADDGLAVASSYRGTASAGQSAAAESLASFRTGVRGAHVNVTRSATNATVTITGHVEQLIPFLDVAVRIHVEGPVERFVNRPGQNTPPPAPGQP